MVKDKIKPAKKTIQIQMDVELFEKAREKAEKNDTNVSQVVRKLLREYLSQQQGTLNF